MAAPSIASLRLVRYKGFSDCAMPLKGSSVLVGANNAGKSSAIGAIRLVAALVPQAQRLNPSITGRSDGTDIRGWPVTQAAVEAAAFSAENVRNDFGSEEARIEVTFASGCQAVVVWPEVEDPDDPPRPFFHVVPPRQYRGSGRAATQQFLPTIGIVPTLAPIEDREAAIGDDALRRNLTGRRTSRYFRNALWRVHEDPVEWRDLVSYLVDNTPEIAGLVIRRVTNAEVDEFDLFYMEAGRHAQRELTWSGDGVQIWLQALFHLWRQAGAPILVLDEPDVYLHPDLQRRLARIVFDRPQQVILATHSIELLAEAEPGAAVWVDRSRRRGERLRRDGFLNTVGRRLGSGFELNVARALRSEVAVFVEGQDMRLLATLAARLEAPRFAARQDYATIPLGGFSRGHVAGGFAEVMAALGAKVKVHVLLDGDLRSDEATMEAVSKFLAKNVSLHVWKRRELENYVLSAIALADDVDIDVAVAKVILDTVVAELKEDTRWVLQAQRIDEREHKLGGLKSVSLKSALQVIEAEFKVQWDDPISRLAAVDGKKCIRDLNAALQREGLKTTSAYDLARHIPAAEIGDDLRTTILEIESDLRRATAGGR